jgi:hypothetical protein
MAFDPSMVNHGPARRQYCMILHSPRLSRLSFQSGVSAVPKSSGQGAQDRELHSVYFALSTAQRLRGNLGLSLEESNRAFGGMRKRTTVWIIFCNIRQYVRRYSCLCSLAISSSSFRLLAWL